MPLYVRTPCHNQDAFWNMGKWFVVVQFDTVRKISKLLLVLEDDENGVKLFDDNENN